MQIMHNFDGMQNNIKCGLNHAPPCIIILVIMGAFIDTPPNSLMDSSTNPKVKTMKGEGVGVCYLARNTSGVKGCAGASRWDQED